MFYAISAKPLRWWVIGLGAGLLGWGLWSMVFTGEEPSGIPMAFERTFLPSDGAVGSEGVQEPDGGDPAPLASLAADAGGLEGGLPASGAMDGQGASRAALDPDGFRAQREQWRSQEMELARRVLDDPGASDARKTEAQAELLKLLQRSRREIETEQLLQAAGITNAVVSLGEAGAQVVVPQPLTSQGAARIGELVARMAGVRREDISIIDSLTAFGAQGAWEESAAGR